ncbi:hypothetical protein TNCT_851 [Trichonephila clavata]|uniref:Uncharacterized protein n=1 Tax=Trichonephila clavata TaxID=2740835 RepID=A0A8X6L0C6_TRICU|nr:hypothetical protein TNCT_851 [Trichonephila clavata]
MIAELANNVMSPKEDWMDKEKTECKPVRTIRSGFFHQFGKEVTFCDLSFYGIITQMKRTRQHISGGSFGGGLGQEIKKK